MSKQLVQIQYGQEENNLLDVCVTNAYKDAKDNQIDTTYATKEENELSKTTDIISGNNPNVNNSINAPLIYGKINGYTEQKTLSGINLFDAISVYNEKDGYSVSDDGTITATVTDDVREWKYTNCECKMTLSSGTYHIKLLNDSVTEHGYAGFYVILTDDTLYRGSDYKAMWNTEYPFTLTEDTDIGIIIKPFTNTFKVMLTKDIDITEYEPYCGGVASPNPDYPQDIVGLGDSGTIEVKTYGKNLCYKNNIKVAAISDDITINNIIGGRTLSFSHTKSRISGTLINNENIYNFSYIKEYDKRGNLLKETKGQYTAVPSESSKSYAFTLSLQENTNYLVINYGNYNTDSTINTLVSDIQIEYSVVSTPYKPYTETVATIPIDTLYEGDYLEVYADGSGKIVRENKKLVLDGKQNYGHIAEWTNESAFQWDGSISDAVYVNGFYTKANLKCSHLPINTPGYISATSGISAIGQGNYGIYLSINGITTWAGLREYLTENPITVIYKLATPTETPLTAEQVEQFKQLYTFDNVTNFFCDGEITARYYVNTDSGDTVGKLQEQVKAIPDVYQKKTIEVIKGLGEWTAGSGASGHLKGVCYGNGKFVAVEGMRGGAYYSEDGITWTAGSGASGYLKGVCYGNDKFVAVDNRGGAYYSEDGITWTAGSGASGYFNSVCYGNGKFVAVGSSGATYYSEDGITWTAGSGASGGFNSVCYGNGKFVAVGASGATYYSEDGITWTAGGSGGSSSFSSVCYGNGKFVAVDSSSATYYSEDGITWTAGGSGASGGFNSVCYGNGKFVAVGASSATYYYYSEDGITWTAGSGAVSEFFNGVCYGNGKFVAVGDGGGIYYSEFIKEQRNLEDVINELYKLLL